MIRTRAEQAEVLYPDEEIVLFGAPDWEELKILALVNPRRRIRLCSHRSPEDRLHEMFIIHTADAYVPPHKHVGRDESFSVLEGKVDLLLFHEDGRLREVVTMGAPGGTVPFYCRIPDSIYHSLLIRTPFLVFHEVTLGPFHREQTVFAPWAPVGNELEQRNILLARSREFRHTQSSKL